jgi:hypothetical protein
VTGNSVAAETRVSTSILHFYCTFRTEMSEWSGDGGPYLSEYEGELRARLEDDVDEFRLAGRARIFIINADAAEDDEEAPSLFELLDLRGETAAYLPLLHSTEPNMFSPAVCLCFSQVITTTCLVGSFPERPSIRCRQLPDAPEVRFDLLPEKVRTLCKYPSEEWRPPRSAREALSAISRVLGHPTRFRGPSAPCPAPSDPTESSPVPQPGRTGLIALDRDGIRAHCSARSTRNCDSEVCRRSSSPRPPGRPCESAGRRAGLRQLNRAAAGVTHDEPAQFVHRGEGIGYAASSRCHGRSMPNPR